MTKRAETSKDPFAQYLKAYEELTDRIKESNSTEAISKLTKEVNEILQDHFKAIMHYYDKQYQQIINHLEENNKRFEQITKNSMARTQDFMEKSIKQSQYLMQHNITQLEKAFKSQPKEFIEQSIKDAQAALSEQTKLWNNLYTEQKEEILKEMEPFQSQVKEMLKDSEALRKEAIENYKKLEKTVHSFLKNKQAELKGKEKDMH
ncbi:MAG: hypothetical protein BGO43_09285 [Gammaproteobacteria bacterium 39-13]|nr:hypothetical protein [Gammaproteobacteria bacterium]OJV93835.1 MAG: hypothetical protein BGO43_09285 [Gammaproteobacteria bacterium 39-13]